ncbi:tryptophan synthase subunit alpha [bacterium]|nr:MAG: tryptophan synthase subunit alpha [bacterium]RIK62342.1 MAG: tryptophan synthase subunit alpha [Planctomycetota bacterium]
MPAELDARFAALGMTGRKALIPFLVAGYPTRERFREVLRTTAAHADVLEIGIPFSDPLADGPTIQAASSKALSAGVTLDRTFAELREHFPKDGPPLVFMITYNQVLAARDFVARCRDHRVAGLIVPDLPFEEAGELRAQCQAAGLSLVSMIAPTTSESRARQIAAAAQGFIYLISVAGTTGARGEFAAETLAYIRKTRALTDNPLCVGFGISKAAHIRQLREYADGFIVGSALVNAIDEGRERELLTQLRAACG